MVFAVKQIDSRTIEYQKNLIYFHKQIWSQRKQNFKIRKKFVLILSDTIVKNI
ncbi:hypothetical protein LEP1GSC132_0981 [Leptospira kirschneri str. 200803703]|nr:hypothetical protein LEP1GSC132_0981 [Leptospira kirschneri str. 200803703]